MNNQLLAIGFYTLLVGVGWYMGWTIPTPLGMILSGVVIILIAIVLYLFRKRE